MVEIRLLAPMELWKDESQLTVPPLKPRVVLTCLATSPEFTATVDQLIRAVWEEKPPAAALNSLHVYVSTLRQLLGRDAVVNHGPSYSLDPSSVVDVQVFEREVASGLRAVERGDDIAATAWLSLALTRWSGKPFATEGSTEFITALRSTATETWLRALEAWSDLRIRSGHAAEVVSKIAGAVQEHPFREVLRARYVLALGASGRQADALASYRSARELMRVELGVDPSAVLVDAQTAVLRAEFPYREPERQERLRLGLSVAVGNLIGREDELHTLERVVGSPAFRVVTVLGHGGIGKTRLVQELVIRDAENSAFVSLASSEPGDDIVNRICDQLGLGHASSPLDALTKTLSSRTTGLTLVLDNVEHLPDAPEVIAQIVAGAPLVTVVATSRVPLGIPGERRLTLSALDATTSAEGRLSPAAELFLDRVWSYDEAFVPSLDDLTNAASIAEKCEGIPLSLEMVAARTTVFTLAELRERLVQSLSSLIAASDGDFGTRSTGAVVRWTISLLSASARGALIAATTFRGGFTAIALAGVMGCDLDSAVDPLRVLVEHSLVGAQTREGIRRFEILEVIRSVVRADLSEEEAAELDARHSAYFRSTLNNSDPDAFFPSKLSELEGIAREGSNYRHAVNVALDLELPFAGELVDLLGVPWMRVGSPSELKAWVERYLATAGVSPELRMACLIHLLRIDQVQNSVGADDIFRRLASIQTSVDNVNLHAALLAYEAIYAGDRGDEDAARAALNRVEQLPRGQTVSYWTSVARLSLFVALEDDEGAIKELIAFLAWAKVEGLELQSVSATQNLIYALLTSGRYTEAADLAIQQFDVVAEADIQSRIVLLQASGEALLWMGQLGAAMTNLDMALVLACQFGSDQLAGDSLVRLAASRVRAQPDDADGAFLAGMALAWIEQSTVQLDHSERRMVTEFLSPVARARAGTPIAESRDAGGNAFRDGGLAVAVEVAERHGRASPAGSLPLPVRGAASE